jgi:hypothetical protein
VGRKKLELKDKKVKINITIEPYQLEILKTMGSTISEAIRKLIDDKLRK